MIVTNRHLDSDASLVEVNRRIEHGLITVEAAAGEAASHGERLNKSTGSPARLARRTGWTESREGEAGFTLVEMLVVITIIGLVMALVGPRVLSYLGNSKLKAAKIQIESFSAALDLYYLDNGAYPTASESLTALIQRPPSAAAWNGPYLRAGSVPDDPWGHPYIYKVPGDHAPYEIDSYGAGTAGDSAEHDQERVAIG